MDKRGSYREEGIVLENSAEIHFLVEQAANLE
jgi:hypothetical protein